LATARKLLARRLARRGLVLSAGSLALLLSQNAASASVPAALVGPTVTAATLFAAGKATAGLISAPVAALTEGVLKTLLLTRVKIATVLLLALAIFAAGAGIVASQTPAAEREDDGRPSLEQGVDPVAAPVLHPADRKDDSPKIDKNDRPPNAKDDGPKNLKDEGPKKPNDDDDDDDDDQKYQGVVKALDVSRNTLSLTVRQKGKDVDKTFNLTKKVQVQVAGKAAPLADVKAGMRVALKLSKDKKAVVEIKEAKGQQDKNAGKSKSSDGSDS
jgi:hypothetical protein